jgi:catechol 2,3-dioxygenase-like lactoylglutathione lyase family enzyme
VAIAQSGGVQIELIQQHCDRPSAYRDLIASGASGFHHVGLYCDDYDANYAWYAGQGYVAAIDGKFGEMRFAYFDTSADIGCMVELIEQNAVQSEFFARIAAAADGWDGVTDPIRFGFPAA